MPTTKVVIFDLDGTLLDTLEDLAAAVNHALQQRGLPLHTTDEYRAMVDKRREDSPVGKRSSTTELLRRRRNGNG